MSTASSVSRAIPSHPTRDVKSKRIRKKPIISFFFSDEKLVIEDQFRNGFCLLAYVVRGQARVCFAVDSSAIVNGFAH